MPIISDGTMQEVMEDLKWVKKNFNVFKELFDNFVNDFLKIYTKLNKSLGIETRELANEERCLEYLGETLFFYLKPSRRNSEWASLIFGRHNIGGGYDCVVSIFFDKDGQCYTDEDELLV
ncbi:MAG: hypothetical protein HQK81_15645 [Desulfovibrionaceae bacterium]|nr:hypothetical protein [Desulfovibrionaceae bacterium]MBF0515476.1 hypothetical protein [Desulfovibrionaceae bacterium]